jgi:hypothetical protein
VVQMTQPEFVDAPVYFDALVLKYSSSLSELLVPTFRIFEQFDWAQRNKNCGTYIELQIKILEFLFQT